MLPFPSPLLMGQASSAAVAWTPSNLAPDVKAWFDAAYGVSLFTAGNVTGWASKVGSTSLSQVNSSYPQFVANTINGLPVVMSGDAPAALQGSYSETGTSLSLAFVGSIANAGNAFGRYVSMSNTGQTADNTNDNSLVVLRAGTGGTTSTIGGRRNGTIGNSDVGYETFFILVITFDGANGYMFVNGTQIGTIAKTANFNINRFTLWRDASAQTGFSYGKAKFAELLTMGRALTTTERQKLEGYLASKFALQSVLPADHPYKSVAPTV